MALCFSFVTGVPRSRQKRLGGYRVHVLLAGAVKIGLEPKQGCSAAFLLFAANANTRAPVGRCSNASIRPARPHIAHPPVVVFSYLNRACASFSNHAAVEGRYWCHIYTVRARQFCSFFPSTPRYAFLGVEVADPKSEDTGKHPVSRGAGLHREFCLLCFSLVRSV